MTNVKALSAFPDLENELQKFSSDLIIVFLNRKQDTTRAGCNVFIGRIDVSMEEVEVCVCVGGCVRGIECFGKRVRRDSSVNFVR